MSSPTNLTDSLTRLRERKVNPATVNRKLAGRTSSQRSQSSGERQFATDTFMVFAYTLLGVATICQLILIVWLDII
ncbi:MULTISPECIES: hypothetical protein [unclassified Lentimonas]|uniref:hypothetical protein n=1 Tax=unclassified Lentimonas TaxID=2630993 RepID=UPI00132282D5|nr:MULTISPECIES: hypothetical protein [unclassified Lentimonas]CAA7180669.1 Unannotated [Lentimonas sp. CC8]CAA6676410.1 Unannotated [Lentimonas sp. CC4]CAA6685249.1 Unannotated [Lentimonas sp. CC6]CAA6690383.1 Unannotated [Lentimonas sp. CC10]CAA6693079.1 Unannotated [Lentimonas sp. CC19]